MVGGLVTGLASSGLAAAGASACPETLGAGCAAAILGANGVVWSVDQMSAGLITLGTGRATPTLGDKLVSNVLGVSPSTGELINGVLGLSPLAADAALANGIIKIPAKVSKVGPSSVPPATRLGSGGASVLLPEYVAGFSESETLATSKGARPAPATYLN